MSDRKHLAKNRIPMAKDTDRPGGNCYKYTYIRHEPSCEMN